MITLITGTPGAGKTLYTVHAILNEEAKGSRPIYVDGIPELKIRHEPAPDILEWHKWAPDGALIVIDEVQRIWRPMPSGARVPESIAELETHRHRGIDFIVITQHPNLMHANVRKLVGKHIHLRRTALGTYLHEWPECANPEARGNSTRIRWSHPKQSFGLYKSASEHTKVKHRMPMAVYIFGAAVLLLGGGSIYMVNTVKERMSPNVKQAINANSPNPTTPFLLGNQPPAAAPYPDTPPEPMNPVIAFMPRYPDDPASAPAFDGLRQVVAVPRIANCIASRTRCICYTQQQTRLQISESLCRRYAEGLEFDPYQEEQKEVVTPVTPVAQVTPPPPQPEQPST